MGLAARPMRRLLYDGLSGVGELWSNLASSVPIVWAYFVRFFPFAVAMLWPVVRQIPLELREAIRLDGATAGQEFRHLVLPLSALPFLRAALAVGILALGEIGASKLVWVMWHPFAHEVFAQMHFGITPPLAAMCLVLLGVVVLGAVGMAGLRALRELPASAATARETPGP